MGEVIHGIDESIFQKLTDIRFLKKSLSAGQNDPGYLKALIEAKYCEIAQSLKDVTVLHDIRYTMQDDMANILIRKYLDTYGGIF
jgi:hypothetical protein